MTAGMEMGLDKSKALATTSWAIGKKFQKRVQGQQRREPAGAPQTQATVGPSHEE
jgi:hypothetical protein